VLYDKPDRGLTKRESSIYDTRKKKRSRAEKKRRRRDREEGRRNDLSRWILRERAQEKFTCSSFLGGEEKRIV